jgi:hypothetical protein
MITTSITVTLPSLSPIVLNESQARQLHAELDRLFGKPGPLTNWHRQLGNREWLQDPPHIGNQPVWLQDPPNTGTPPLGQPWTVTCKITDALAR